MAKYGLLGRSLASCCSLPHQGGEDQWQGQHNSWWMLVHVNENFISIAITITSSFESRQWLQVVYFTSLFPYCVLLVLAVRGWVFIILHSSEKNICFHKPRSLTAFMKWNVYSEKKKWCPSIEMNSVKIKIFHPKLIAANPKDSPFPERSKGFPTTWGQFF